jgi:hypothetical protein
MSESFWQPMFSAPRLYGAKIIALCNDYSGVACIVLSDGGWMSLDGQEYSFEEVEQEFAGWIAAPAATPKFKPKPVNTSA